MFIKEAEKSTLKFTWKHKRPQIAKVALSKKSNTRGITITDFRSIAILQIHRNKNSIVLAQKQT
jgi:hypothetical protein